MVVELVFVRGGKQLFRASSFAGYVGVLTGMRHATEAGIELSSLDETPRLDLTVDGADEIDRNLMTVLCDDLLGLLDPIDLTLAKALQLGENRLLTDLDLGT